MVGFGGIGSVGIVECVGGDAVATLLRVWLGRAAWGGLAFALVATAYVLFVRFTPSP